MRLAIVDGEDVGALGDGLSLTQLAVSFDEHFASKNPGLICS